MPTSRILEVTRGVDSPSLGICSDPANTVAALEMPREVIGAVAPYVLTSKRATTPSSTAGTPPRARNASAPKALSPR